LGLKNFALIERKRTKIELMKTRLLLFVAAVLFVLNAMTQTVKSEKRIEIELKDGYSGERVFEFDSLGMLLLSTQDIKEGENMVYRFQKYNTDLVEISEVNYSINQAFRFDKSFQEGNDLHIFFKSRKGDYRILTYNFLSQKFHETSGVLPNKTGVVSTLYMNEMAYFLLKNRKNMYQVLTIDLNSEKESFSPIVIEGIKPRNMSVTSFETMPESKNILASTRVKLSRKMSEMNLIRLNEKGEIAQRTELKAENGNTIKDAQSFDLGNNNFFISGTYAAKGKVGSNGIYITRIENGIVQPVYYHNFTDLKSFFTYTRKQDQSFFKKVKEGKAKRGKELNISYLIASHRPIRVNDDFLYIGEAFYPTYRTEQKTVTTMVNGKYVTKTTYEQVFDGFQYTHAIVAKFDRDGKLLWDESFPMVVQKPFYVKRFIQIDENESEKLKLVFATDNSITTKILDFDGNVIVDKTSGQIETNLEEDKTKFSYVDIEHWFGDYFLAYGEQKIVNKENKDVKKVRKVYFFNKVKLD
jgi:hypothetical protein